MKNQQGSILIFSVLMLGVILTITLALGNIFLPRLRTSTETINSVAAAYAADSAMEWCLYGNRGKSPSLPQPTMQNGATYQIYRNGVLSTCPSGETLNYRTVGTFRGATRSFEISE